MSEFIIHVRTVAEYDEDVAILARHGGTPAAGDLVAHGRRAHFAVEAIGVGDPPSLGQFADDAAGRGEHHVLRIRRPVHDADHLRIRRHEGVVRGLEFINQCVPIGHVGLTLCQPIRVRPPRAKTGIDISEASRT